MPYFLADDYNRKFVRYLDWCRLTGAHEHPERSSLSGKTMTHAIATDSTLTERDIAIIQETEFSAGSPGEEGRPWPDVFLGVHVVSRRTRSIIEELEPGVHGFIPIRIRNNLKGGFLEGYSVMQVRTYLDCFDYSQTDWCAHGPETGFELARKAGFSPSLGTPYVLRSGTFEGHHIWSAAAPADWRWFVSDELKAALSAAKIIGWAFKKCKVSKEQKSLQG